MQGRGGVRSDWTIEGDEMDDDSELEERVAPFSWRSLTMGEKAGVWVVCLFGASMLASLVMLLVKLWMWLL